MSSRVLEYLKTPQFYGSVGLVQTPAPLRYVLKRLPGVRQIAIALQHGSITESMIRSFISSIVREYREGYRLPGELALAALAVVLELRPTDFAEEYLQDLAGLHLVEMIVSANVARECLKYRRALPKHQSRSFTYPTGKLIPRQISAVKSTRGHFRRRTQAPARYPHHSGAA
jgi:hypothetical protein